MLILFRFQESVLSEAEHSFLEPAPPEFRNHTSFPPLWLNHRPHAVEPTDRRKKERESRQGKNRIRIAGFLKVSICGFLLSKFSFRRFDSRKPSGSTFKPETKFSHLIGTAEHEKLVSDSEPFLRPGIQAMKAVSLDSSYLNSGDATDIEFGETAVDMRRFFGNRKCLHSDICKFARCRRFRIRSFENFSSLRNLLRISEEKQPVSRKKNRARIRISHE